VLVFSGLCRLLPLWIAHHIDLIVTGSKATVASVIKNDHPRSLKLWVISVAETPVTFANVHEVCAIITETRMTVVEVRTG